MIPLFLKYRSVFRTVVQLLTLLPAVWQHCYVCVHLCWSLSTKAPEQHPHLCIPRLLRSSQECCRHITKLCGTGLVEWVLNRLSASMGRLKLVSQKAMDPCKDEKVCWDYPPKKNPEIQVAGKVLGLVFPFRSFLTIMTAIAWLSIKSSKNREFCCFNPRGILQRQRTASEVFVAPHSHLHATSGRPAARAKQLRERGELFHYPA